MNYGVVCVVRRGCFSRSTKTLQMILLSILIICMPKQMFHTERISFAKCWFSWKKAFQGEEKNSQTPWRQFSRTENNKKYNFKVTHVRYDDHQRCVFIRNLFGESLIICRLPVAIIGFVKHLMCDVTCHKTLRIYIQQHRIPSIRMALSCVYIVELAPGSIKCARSLQHYLTYWTKCLQHPHWHARKAARFLIRTEWSISHTRVRLICFRFKSKKKKKSVRFWCTPAKL